MGYKGKGLVVFDRSSKRSLKYVYVLRKEGGGGIGCI